MNPEVHYSTNSVDPFFSLILSIDANGIATLSIGTNRGNPELGAVGLFRQEIDKEQLAILVAALRLRDFNEIQNPDSTYPGERKRILSIKEEGRGEVVKWVRFDNPGPLAFRKAEAQALALVNLVKQHPVFALAMAVNSIPERLDRGKPIELIMTLVNSGSKTIQLPHPDTWSEGVAQLLLNGLRSDIPIDKLLDYHQRFEELSKSKLLKIQGTKVARPLIILPPGDHIVFTFRIKLDWPPGQYNLQLSLITALLDQNGVEQVRCDLTSKLFPIKVFGKSKPGDEPK